MNLSNIPHFLLIIGEVLVLFNLLIVVHELGHFWAARWRGLVVEKFAIWFGKPLWRKRINGVEFSLGCIPAGGYVALPQMAPMETLEGRGEDSLPREQLPPISPLDKIIVAAAGPIFSFGLALIFAVLVWGIGRPVSESETTTTIGYVYKDSVADRAGLKAGDRILTIDGQRVTRFSGMSDTSISWRIVRSEGETIAIQVERNGEPLAFNVKPEKEERTVFQRPSLRQIMIAPAHTPMIAQIFPNSPAAQAGLKPNDLVISVNHQKILSREAMGEIVQNSGDQPLTLQVMRGREFLEFTLKASVPVGEKTPRLGIQWDSMGQMTLVHPTPLEQITLSVSSMVNTISAIFSPKSDIKPQHLSGPIGIMRFYYLLFESEQGWRLALWFSVLFNVNLAIMNLLPIPVLDGGHILLAVIEWLRGRPLNERLLGFVQTACASLVIGYLLYVTFFDVQDLPWRGKPAAAPTMQFAPPETPAKP